VISSQQDLNQRVRRTLAKAELQSPGTRERAERIAVYAVAVGHRIGVGSDGLLGLRFTAELHGIDDVEPELRAAIARDEMSEHIVRLCQEFDLRNHGFAEEGVEWLKHEALSEFAQGLVDALLAVQAVIQPVGS
jgi:hypothetical protein